MNSNHTAGDRAQAAALLAQDQLTLQDRNGRSQNHSSEKRNSLSAFYSISAQHLWLGVSYVRALFAFALYPYPG